MAQFESIKFQPQRPLLRELSADRLNTILQEIRRNKPKGERGITVRQSGDGTYIGLASAIPAGGASAASRRLPWDIYVEDTEGEGDSISYTLKVQPGTLARVLPDNYDNDWSANNSDLYYGIARVSTDGTYITSVSIDISSSAPSPQVATEWSLPDSVDILFGLFVGGQSYNVADGGNIDAYGKNVLISSDNATEIGDPVYKLWFKLQ